MNDAIKKKLLRTMNSIASKEKCYNCVKTFRSTGKRGEPCPHCHFYQYPEEVARGGA